MAAPGRRSGASAFGLDQASGQQDVGIGLQHLLSDTAFVQQAVQVFATVPSGYPSGILGFTAGGRTYYVTHTVALPSATFSGLALPNGIVGAPGIAPINATK